MTIPVIRRRADFLAANRGLRVAQPGFVLLVRPNAAPHAAENNAAGFAGKDAAASSTAEKNAPEKSIDASSTAKSSARGMRYGITVTKKIGNAVVRNRMKRRFRELLRATLPEHGLPDHDHVLIGREAGVERDYHLLAEELQAALARAAAGKGDRPRSRRRAAKGGKRGPKHAPDRAQKRAGKSADNKAEPRP